MSLKFSPGLLVDGLFFGLPGPVTRLQVQDHWDFDRYKVLLTDGDSTKGLSRMGVDISVAGGVGVQENQTLLTETAMFDTIEELRLLLESQKTVPFIFYLYRDAVSSKCRYFKKCTVARFQYDLSQPELYSYTLTLHADDPVLYQTWLEE